MNVITRTLFTALGIALFAVACGSTPQQNYYLLEAGTSHKPGGTSPSLGIGPIEIPEYLNRNGLIYNRQGSKLSIANHERWAEPIDSGVERVMTLNLAGLLNTEDVRAYPWSQRQKPQYGIRVTLRSLDISAAKAQLIADWVINKPATGEVVTTQVSHLNHDLPTTDNVPAQVAPAYSALLFQLSEEIAAAIDNDLN